MARFDRLSALVLHVQDYRETSALVQFLTREQGRITGVFQGMRRGRKGGALQTFCVGKLSCSGASGLMTVTRFEEISRYDLHGDHLSGGFYVLELITRVLAERQVERDVFDAALETLGALQREQAMASALRAFERCILQAAGVAVDYAYDYQHATRVRPDQHYQWVAEHGFRPAGADVQGAIPGAALLAMARGAFDEPLARRPSRQLHQQLLAPLLGPRPLVSRQMLVRMQAKDEREG